jgi:hypothetical protein
VSSWDGGGRDGSEGWRLTILGGSDEGLREWSSPAPLTSLRGDCARVGSAERDLERFRRADELAAKIREKARAMGER